LETFTKFLIISKKLKRKKALLFLSCIRHFGWHKIGFVGCVKYWSCLLRRKNGGMNHEEIGFVGCVRIGTGL